MQLLFFLFIPISWISVKWEELFMLFIFVKVKINVIIKCNAHSICFETKKKRKICSSSSSSSWSLLYAWLMNIVGLSCATFVFDVHTCDDYYIRFVRYIVENNNKKWQKVQKKREAINPKYNQHITHIGRYYDLEVFLSKMVTQFRLRDVMKINRTNISILKEI